MPPIRLIHHMARSGGTLISRCVAALPKIVLVSEISPAGHQLRSRFDPLSPLAQFTASYPGLRPPNAAIGTLVGQQLRFLIRHAERLSRELVVRDHSHSDFMGRHGDCTSSILPAIEGIAKPISIVTARYPLASYLSLVGHGWDEMLVDYEDYCERYLKFLDAYAEVPVFQYEKFCNDPVEEMRAIARALKIGFGSQFRSSWQNQRLSGDGQEEQQGSKIAIRPMEGYSEQLRQEVAGLKVHKTLCERLGYAPDLKVYARETNQSALRARPGDAKVLETLKTIGSDE